MDDFIAGAMNSKLKLAVVLLVCFVSRDVCCMSADDTGKGGLGHDVVELLLKRVDDLERKVELQDAVNRQQHDLNERLKEKLIVLEQELENVKSRKPVAGGSNDRYEAPNHDKTGPSAALSSRRRGIRQAEVVAFTAYLDHNLSNLGIDQPVVYDKIILNEGNAYNNTTGIFTCPMDGIYVFNFMVSSNGVQQMVAKLVVDNVNMVDGISDTFHVNHEAQGGNYAIFSLRRGQSVWVENYRWTTHGDSSSDLYRFSTFAGHLML